MNKKFFQNLGVKGSEIIGSHYSYSRIQAKMILLSTEQTELIISPVMVPLETQALMCGLATAGCVKDPLIIVDVLVHYKCISELSFSCGKEGW